MGIKSHYETRVLTKMYNKFVKQLDYAFQVIYATFADTIDMQMPSGTDESTLHKKLLQRAVTELLGSPENYLQDYDEAEKKIIKTYRSVIDDDKHEILNSQPDIREYIVQTDRMQLYYGMQSDEHFLESDYGKALSKILEVYGGEFPMIYPSTYDRLCETVAKKTDSLKLYKKILKNKT